jgi:hypothetical protein
VIHLALTSTSRNRDPSVGQLVILRFNTFVLATIDCRNEDSPTALELCILPRNRLFHSLPNLPLAHNHLFSDFTKLERWSAEITAEQSRDEPLAPVRRRDPLALPLVFL